MFGRVVHEFLQCLEGSCTGSRGVWWGGARVLVVFGGVVHGFLRCLVGSRMGLAVFGPVVHGFSPCLVWLCTGSRGVWWGRAVWWVTWDVRKYRVMYAEVTFKPSEN